MEEDKSIPAYVPQVRIWFDFATYGVLALANTVEQRVRELGLEVRPPSPIEELKRYRRQREINERRTAFVRSKDGYEFWRDQVALVGATLTEVVGRIEDDRPPVAFR